MSKTTRKLTTISAGALLAASLGSTNVISQDYDEESMQQTDPPVADAMVAGEFIDFTAHIEFERATVRVSGPKGYSATIQIPAGSSAITADLIHDAAPGMIEDIDLHAYASEADGSWHTLPDGEYRYEIVLISGEGVIGRKTGAFRVESGMASDNDHHNSQSDTTTPTLFHRMAGAVLELLIPSAHAQVVATDNWLNVLDASENDETYVRYANDSDTSGNWWRVGNYGGDFLWNKGFASTGNVMVLRDVVENDSDGRLGIGTTNPLDMFHAANDGGGIAALRIENDTTGYRLYSGRGTGFSIRQTMPSAESGTPFQIERGAPSNSLYIDEDGSVGIGTPSPEDELHVDGVVRVDEVRLGGSNGFGIGMASGTVPFAIHADAPNQALFILENEVVIQPQMDLGVGTNAPDAPLHVRRTNGTAQVLVEETSSGDATLFELSNNGHSRFIFRDTSTSNLWEFRTAGSGDFERFQINRLGSGDLEMQVRRGGNMIIAGSLTEGSSREIKNGISEVSADEVLKKLAQLKVHEWSYKSNEETRHLGPMAEDFHEIFGLGMGPTSIAPRDLAGIALAAAQALQSENTVLENRLADLEERLDRLTGMDSLLSSN